MILNADNLLQYCFWRASLDANRSTEWDKFLESLQPEANPTAKLDAFRFSDEQSAQRSPGQGDNRSAFPRNLLKAALGEKPAVGQ